MMIRVQLLVFVVHKEVWIAVVVDIKDKCLNNQCQNMHNHESSIDNQWQFIFRINETVNQTETSSNSIGSISHPRTFVNDDDPLNVRFVYYNSLSIGAFCVLVRIANNLQIFCDVHPIAVEGMVDVRLVIDGYQTNIIQIEILDNITIDSVSSTLLVSAQTVTNVNLIKGCRFSSVTQYRKHNYDEYNSGNKMMNTIDTGDDSYKCQKMDNINDSTPYFVFTAAYHVSTTLFECFITLQLVNNNCHYFNNSIVFHLPHNGMSFFIYGYDYLNRYTVVTNDQFNVILSAVSCYNFTVRNDATIECLVCLDVPIGENTIYLISQADEILVSAQDVTPAAIYITINDDSEITTTTTNDVYNVYLCDYFDLNYTSLISNSSLTWNFTGNGENNSSIITHGPHTIHLFTYHKQIASLLLYIDTFMQFTTNVSITAILCGATEIVLVYQSDLDPTNDRNCYSVIVDAIFIDNNSICPLEDSCDETPTTQVVNMFVSVSENSINFIGAIGTDYNFSYYILPPKITHSSSSFVYANQVAWTLFIIDWVCIGIIPGDTNVADNYDIVSIFVYNCGYANSTSTWIFETIVTEAILSIRSVTIYNHLSIVYGENPIEINMIHVEANNTKGIELIDNRTISGSQIFVNNSVFMNHLAGYDMSIKFDDSMIFTNCQYTTFSIGFVTSTNAIESATGSGCCRLSGELEWNYSYSQIVFDNFQVTIRYQNWSTNATFYNGMFYNKDNYNNTDSALVFMLNGYSNKKQKSAIKFDRVEFAGSGDIQDSRFPDCIWILGGYFYPSVVCCFNISTNHIYLYDTLTYTGYNGVYHAANTESDFIYYAAHTGIILVL